MVIQLHDYWDNIIDVNKIDDVYISEEWNSDNVYTYLHVYFKKNYMPIKFLYDNRVIKDDYKEIISILKTIKGE